MKQSQQIIESLKEHPTVFDRYRVGDSVVTKTSFTDRNGKRAIAGASGTITKVNQRVTYQSTFNVKVGKVTVEVSSGDMDKLFRKA